jgi:hypothetical protein
MANPHSLCSRRRLLGHLRIYTGGTGKCQSASGNNTFKARTTGNWKTATSRVLPPGTVKAEKMRAARGCGLHVAQSHRAPRRLTKSPLGRRR